MSAHRGLLSHRRNKATVGQSKGALHAQPSSISLEALPSYTREVGVQIFGSLAALSAVLNNTVVRQVHTLSGALTLNVASMRGDRSVQHLQREMRGDRYNVRDGFLQRSSNGVVVDVGANLGYFTLTVAKLYPQMRVIAVEPTPPTFFFLTLNLHLNRVRRLSPTAFSETVHAGVLPLHAAIGRTADKRSSNGSVTMHYPVGFSDSQLATAVSDPALPARGGWRTHPVPLIQMADYLEASSVRSVRMLKTDCEGCEWTLLPSLAQWLTPPVSTPGMKMRFWRWPSWTRPFRPRIERLVGELHSGALEPDFDFEKRRKIGRQVMRPAVDDVFQTIRLLTERGCDVGLPGHVELNAC